jgi:glycosyltransferase involved in cell wall biosynthesis
MNKNVCIAIPVYNSCETISKTLNSIVCQDYQNIKVFICDNNSNDGTDKIISKFQNDFPDLITYLFNPLVLDGEANWIFLLNNLPDTFDYVALFHSDDVYEPSIISEQVSLLEKTNAGASFTTANLINKNDQNINDKLNHSPYLPDDLYYKYLFGFDEIYLSILKNHNFIKTPSVVFDYKKMANYLPLFRSEFNSSADLDLWLRIAKKDGIALLNKPLLNYRITPTQGSSILSKGRFKQADYFKVMDFHFKLDFINHPHLRWFEAMRAIDSIRCSYNLLRISKDKEAITMLKDALNSSNMFYMFKINGGYKHLILGCVLFLLMKIHVHKFVIRYLVLDI